MSKTTSLYQECETLLKKQV